MCRRKNPNEVWLCQVKQRRCRCEVKRAARAHRRFACRKRTWFEKRSLCLMGKVIFLCLRTTKRSRIEVRTTKSGALCSLKNWNLVCSFLEKCFDFFTDPVVLVIVDIMGTIQLDNFCVPYSICIPLSGICQFRCGGIVGNK